MRLRAALSHRDKAKLSIQECAQAFASGAISKARHDSLYEFYSGHLRAAEQEITAARADQRRLLESLQTKLSAALDSQFNISERATSGDLTAAKANARNRQLTADIENFRRAITECASLISANSPAELGGFVDRPLDQYTRPTEGETAQVSRLGRTATYLLPLVMLFTAFLPWLKLGNDTRPLFDMAPLLSAASIAPDPAPPGLRFLWFPFVLIPLLVYPASFLRDKQNAGWGLILTGLLAVSAVLAPLCALSANPGSPVSFQEFIGGLQFGALAYLASGAAIAGLGIRRLGGDAELSISRRRSVLLYAALGTAVLLAGAATLLLTSRPFQVLFEAHQPDPATGRIEFSCQNKENTDIILYVPWPEEGRRGITGANTTFGLSLYVQPENSTEFKLLPLSQDCWVRGGVPFPENRALRIEVQHGLSFALDTRRVQDITGAIQRVRLVVTRADGRTVYSFDSDTLKPRHSVRPPAPGGNAAASPTTPGAGNASPAPSAPVAPTVRYVGSVGNKVALALFEPGTDRPRNLSLNKGDTVVGRWILENVQSQPPSVVLLEERTGRRVTISRGSIEALPAGRP